MTDNSTLPIVGFNEMVCVVSNAPAYAFASEKLPEICGWYGSEIADMERFALVDLNFPRGPVADSVIVQAIADGRIVQAEPMPAWALPSTPDATVRAILHLGICTALSLRGDAWMDGRIDAYNWNPDVLSNQDRVAEGAPLSEAGFDVVVLTKRGGVEKIDLAEFGMIIAAIAAACDQPLDDASRMNAVLDTAVACLKSAPAPLILKDLIAVLQELGFVKPQAEAAPAA